MGIDHQQDIKRMVKLAHFCIANFSDNLVSHPLPICVLILLLTCETEEDTKERVKRAAAAARRWREYSRKGADRPPTFKLPEAASNQE